MKSVFLMMLVLSSVSFAGPKDDYEKSSESKSYQDRMIEINRLIREQNVNPQGMVFETEKVEIKGNCGPGWGLPEVSCGYATVIYASNGKYACKVDMGGNAAHCALIPKDNPVQK